MLFGKRKRIVKRILIVEDEPLTAFDTETMLADFGYEVVATIDDFDEAIERLDRDVIHLVIADVRLHGADLGIELARNARVRGVPTLLATGHESPRRYQDEFLFWALAKNFAGGDGLTWRGVGLDMKSWLYPVQPPH